MSETFSKIILTKSGVSQAQPAAADLDYGELAINYSDGRLFFKDSDNTITTIASSQELSSLNSHKNNINNPHNVTAAQLGLQNFVDLSPSTLETSQTTLLALAEKADQSETYTKAEVDANISSGITDKITLDNLSVGPTEQPNGNGALSYDPLNGEFTYTPPALDTEFFRESISVGATAAPNGGGGLTYNNSNGEFTYTPPGVSDLTSISVASQASPLGNGGIAFNSSNGELTYTPPVINSLTNLGDVDFGSNKILYSNHYATTNDLPSASTYHGMFAHVHSTGKGYFAHAGNWVELANYSDIPNGLNGLGEVINEDRFIVSTGTGAFEYQSGTTVRDSLGLGVDDTPEFDGIDLDGGDLVLDIVGNTKITTSGPPNQIDFEFDDGLNTNTSESKLQISYDVVNGNGAIAPTTNDDIDLGSSSSKFRTLHADSIELSDLIVTGGTLGFYGTAGQNQPDTNSGSATHVSDTSNSAARVNINDTFDGYTLSQVVRALRDLGLLA
jgi:hypothetical protein